MNFKESYGNKVGHVLKLGPVTFNDGEQILSGPRDFTTSSEESIENISEPKDKHLMASFEL